LFGWPPRAVMDLGTFRPVRHLRVVGDLGKGMAVCGALGLLVTNSVETDTLSVYRVHERWEHRPVLEYVLGGSPSHHPMHFKFDSGPGGAGRRYVPESGVLAFGSAGRGSPPLLFVTDAGHFTVHVIDVVARRHVGYVGGFRSAGRARGVAARGCLVAVSSRGRSRSTPDVVTLYQGAGAVWDLLRVIGGLHDPGSLRFTADCARIVVTSWYGPYVTMYAVADGCFVRHVVCKCKTNLPAPLDVEQVRGGWLVAHGDLSGTRWNKVAFVDEEGGAVRSAVRNGRGTGRGQFVFPSALAHVPGFGLVVRDGTEVLFFADPDEAAMAGMSAGRTAWMGVCCRLILSKMMGFQGRNDQAGG